MLWKSIFGNSINQNENMKNIVTLLLILYTSFGFCQDKELYRMAFADKNNFNYLNFYDDTTLDRMDTLKVLKTTKKLPSSMFKYNRDTYYTKELADSLLIYSNMHNKTNTINYINKISELLTVEEQDYLADAASTFPNNDLENIPVKNVLLVDTLDSEDYMFSATNVVYTKNKKYAFLRVGVEVASAYFLGIITFIFEKNDENSHYLHG